VAKKPLRVSKKKSKGKKAKLSASQVAWRESAMEEHSEECESVVAEIVAVLEEGEVVLVSNAASSESELVEVAAIFDAGDEVPNPVKDLGWKGRSAPTPFAFCLREMLKAEGVVVKAWVPSMAK